MDSLKSLNKNPLGRPKKSETACRITINCPGDLAAKIKALAAQKKVSLSEEIVTAIEKHLKP